MSPVKRRALTLVILAAAMSASTLAPGSASVAPYETPSSDSLGVQAASPDTEPSMPPSDPAPRDLQPVVPVTPTPALDCYPIGKVRPAKPGAIRLPEATPELPGPVPIPEVRITCGPEQVSPPLVLDRPRG
jgi:hypothetical protein